MRSYRAVPLPDGPAGDFRRQERVASQDFRIRGMTSKVARGARRAPGRFALLAFALAAAVCGLLWVVIVLAVRWVLQLPPPALARLAAVAGLFAGSALIFVSLVRVELSIRPSPDRHRGRRPSAAALRVSPAGLPSRADGSTAPPRAGGRALRAQGSR